MKKLICLKLATVIALSTTCLNTVNPSAATNFYYPLPSGNYGIASKYAGDFNIGSDPEVILAEDFENYSKMSDLRRAWSTINEDHMNLSSDRENLIGGKQSLQLNLPAQNIERYTGLDLNLPENKRQDTVFVRYYQKIDKSYSISNTTSNHNGASISSRYYNCGADSGPGICANGTNKFLAMLQSTQSTVFEGHNMMIYTYHPDMRYNSQTPSPFDKEIRPSTPRGEQYGDHLYPDGTVCPWTYKKGNYGEGFVERPIYRIELGEWYCYELMLKANAPGQRDGRLTAWINGETVMDFGNMRFRDIEDLKIDSVGFTFGCASTPTATKSWFDNIVIATSYIGPIYEGSLKGDINSDSLVDGTDIAMLQEHILAQTALTDKQAVIANMDSDETLDVFDLVMLRNKAI